jgi:hypothetical protein
MGTSKVPAEAGYCIILPGGRMYFEKGGRYGFTWVGAQLRVMFPGPAFMGVPTRLPLRGDLHRRLIPYSDEPSLHHGEDV